MKSTVTIRINAKNWRKLKQIFPSRKDESVAGYFERFIEEIIEDN